MGIFKSILRQIGVWLYPQSRPIALESSALGVLPPELVLCIAQFLSPVSTLSFSLCCRPIHSLLKSQYVEITKEVQNLDHYEFLTLLERDLPNYILCYYCERLHAMKNAHEYVYSNWCRREYTLPCWQADYNAILGLYIYRDFSFPVFQMAMKLYRQGLDYSKLLKLLSHENEAYPHHGYVEHRTASSKIVAGSLVIRQETRFTMPPTQPLTALRDINVFICPHIRFRSLKIVNQHRKVRNGTYWTESRGYQNSNKLIKCSYCLTEFQIDFTELGKQGYAMYFRKWQDLGQGLSPLDHQWQSHISRGDLGPLQRVKFDRGSIYAAFEGKEHMEFEFNTLILTE